MTGPLTLQRGNYTICVNETLWFKKILIWDFMNTIKSDYTPCHGNQAIYNLKKDDDFIYHLLRPALNM